MNKMTCKRVVINLIIILCIHVTDSYGNNCTDGKFMIIPGVTYCTSCPRNSIPTTDTSSCQSSILGYFLNQTLVAWYNTTNTFTGLNVTTNTFAIDDSLPFYGGIGGNLNVENCLADSSGNGYDLTSVNRAGCSQSSFVRGTSAGQYSIVNVSGFLVNNIPDPVTMKKSTGVTVPCWVRVTSWSNWANVFQYFTGTQGLWLLKKYGTKYYLKAYLTSGMQTLNSYIANPANGIWRHVVWVIDNTGNHYIWMNNTAWLCPSGCGASLTGNFYSAGTPYLTLGSLPTYTMDGYIDDFRVYNKVLTQTDVSELYNGHVSVYFNSYQQCNEGAYTPQTGMSVCTLCAAGTYQSSTNASFCFSCANGAY